MRVLHINCNYTNSALHRIMIRHLTAHGGEHRVFIPTDGGIPFTCGENEIEAKCFRHLDRYVYFKKQAQIMAAAEKAGGQSISTWSYSSSRSLSQLASAIGSAAPIPAAAWRRMPASPSSRKAS